jgi:hypothetical protein
MGSKIQLVSKGDLDTFLTGNPSITFFKSVYRKHTNFSMEDMRIGQISTPKISGKYGVKIPIGTGDLLYGTNLILKGNKVFCGNGIANISTAVINNIAFTIDSREIDRTYGHYLEVYHELNQENPNSTITNLGRIEDSSLYHIGHNADLAAMAVHKSMISNNRSETSYFDNNLAKPTNIMGHGLGYPPTHFQRSSKCGGTYCAPSYLQNEHALTQPTNNSSHSSNYNYVSSINTKPTSSAHVSGMNRQQVDLRIVGYKTGLAAGLNYLVYTMDETGANWVNFNSGDKLKLISATGANSSELTNAFTINTEKEVLYQDGNKIYIKETLTTSTGDADTGKIVDATFKLTQDNWSGNLLNASQIADSSKKGDIIGECNVPLNFWYCRSPGLSIPLVSLNKGTSVELYIHFAGKDDADWTSTSTTSLSNSNFISYDSQINGVNDITNAYKIGDGNQECKAVYDSSIGTFNFNMDVSVTYIFLDNMERQRFQNSSHEYLIEQLQLHKHNTLTQNIDISSFHHPVKELIWCGQPYLKGDIKSINANSVTSGEVTIANSLNNGTSAHPSGIRFVGGMSGPDIEDVLYGGGIHNSNYTNGFGNASFSDIWSSSDSPNSTHINYNDGSAATNINSGKFVQGLLGPSTPDCLNYCSYKLTLNGIDRCQWKPLQYYTRENVRKYHKGGNISVPDSIAVFSFALNPNNTEPSGTCNFSNIDIILLERNQTADYKKVNVYAINYNILRFVNGQAGLTYIA